MSDNVIPFRPRSRRLVSAERLELERMAEYFTARLEHLAPGPDRDRVEASLARARDLGIRPQGRVT